MPAGLDIKITPPHSAEQSTGHLSKAVMQREMARQAAQEKELVRYIKISCGHITDLETQHQYAVFRATKRQGQVFCEQCCKWLPVEKKVTPVTTYSETPLF